MKEHEKKYEKWICSNLLTYKHICMQAYTLKHTFHFFFWMEGSFMLGDWKFFWGTCKVIYLEIKIKRQDLGSSVGARFFNVIFFENSRQFQFNWSTASRCEILIKFNETLTSRFKSYT